MAHIPKIQRSIMLTKKISGKEIAEALKSISSSFGTYIERLQSDIDGLRSFDIGILKDGKCTQTGQIIRVDSTRGLDNKGLETGIIFDEFYQRGDKLMVVNHRWEDQVAHYYAPYNEKKVIKAVESLKRGLEVVLSK